MIPVLLVAGLLAAGIVIGVFWKEITSFLKVALEKVKQVVSAAIVGVATYVQTKDVKSSLLAAHKFYSQTQEGKWQETIVTKTISPKDLPENIRKKLQATNGAVDISEELELALNK